MRATSSRPEERRSTGPVNVSSGLVASSYTVVREFRSVEPRRNERTSGRNNDSKLAGNRGKPARKKREDRFYRIAVVPYDGYALFSLLALIYAGRNTRKETRNSRARVPPPKSQSTSNTVHRGPVRVSACQGWKTQLPGQPRRAPSSIHSPCKSCRLDRGL